MAFITELDIVNACLKSMGEQPLNSTAGGSPIVTAALESMRLALMQEQGIGWWFNKETVTITANTDGQYYIPSDTLSINSDVEPPWLTSRGSRLYDTRIGDYYTGKGDMKVHILRMLPLDDMPYNAQRLIQAAAVLDFQSSFDADEAKVNKANADYTKAFTIVKAEHIRNVKANVLTQGAVGSMRARQKHMWPDGSRR